MMQRMNSLRWKNGKKKPMRGLVLGLAAAAAVGMGAAAYTTALAADQEYTYTVRIFSGAKGTIDGQDVIVRDGLKYGDTISFYPQHDVSVTDSKYYVKGIRESGKDNNTVGKTTGQLTGNVDLSTITVEGDADYVVAYGIRGNSVAYTVNYQDADGNTLAPSETYYGNVGDKPVIAYLYVDGYQPQAYNLTKTLSENAAENQLTFVYSRITASQAGSEAANASTTAVTSTTTTRIAARSTSRPAATAGASAGATGSDAGTKAASAGTTDTDRNTSAGNADAGTEETGEAGAVDTKNTVAGEAAAGVAEVAGNGPAEPQELLDADEDEEAGALMTPAREDAGSSAPAEIETAGQKTLSTAAKAAIGIIIAAVAVLLIALLAHKRRKNNEEETE